MHPLRTFILTNTLPLKRDEPSFGGHSIFKDTDDTIYLLGGGANLQNHLARIPAHLDLTRRENYTYLSRGNKWVSSFRSQTELKVLLPDTAQGSILKPAFAPPGKPYMYFGVGWWCKSKFYIAAAPSIEGPWDLHHLATAGRLNGVSQFRYCIYPHEWSWRSETGELFCSWSEDGPTRVIGATVRFTTGGELERGGDGVGEEGDTTAHAMDEEEREGTAASGVLQGALQKIMSVFR